MHRQRSPLSQQHPEPESQPHTPSPSSQPPIPPSFTRRKQAILDQLSVPDEDYTDLSPKGTIDAGIRDLIDEINALDGLVTTSSCGGRVSVFLEGRRGGKGGELLPGHYLAVMDGEDGEGGEREEVAGEDGDGDDEGVDVENLREPAVVAGEAGGGGGGGGGTTVAGVGGKGGGGRWLYVSHDPVETHGKLDCEPNIVAALLGMEEPIFDGREGISAAEMSGGESRLIHFKFEPMILHVLTASPHHAQLILRCGLQAGFRESGAINLLPASASPDAVTPIVAIRSMGLGLESLIGRETNRIKHCTVSGEYLKALIKIANERFVENARRIERFRMLLREATAAGGGKARVRKGDGGGEWEDAEVRRERKRLEGLRKAEEVRRVKELQRREGEEDGGTPVMPGEVVVEEMQ
ncbi:tRNA wybutosine-synthesizing protein 3 [Cytospora mali]|uniref:tRNA(Phe) 7-[(3-amino-3-carboxypropyl)-4-demethylwyosine(37)-N(4)]-methyltransferase n=1 Tax=Cytospora mali TaxID=578113 RepID=A0A194VMY0_CYTMA|nr:tRNA wybutosine-synthesizing protein 3 [Valsa mali]